MKTDQGKLILDCEKAADMLIQAGLVTKDTDMTAFFTETMAYVMDRFRLPHHEWKKETRAYALDTQGDSKAEAALAQNRVSAPFEIAPQNINIEGSSIAITGASAQYARKLLQEKIEAAGGVFAKSVSSKTQYLVVCDKASPGYMYGSFGEKRAEAARMGITLVAECDLIKALKEKGLL